MVPSFSTVIQYSKGSCSAEKLIIPVPKKAHPTENNDFRPVALISVMMNCLEKCVASMLKEDVNNKLDHYSLLTCRDGV